MANYANLKATINANIKANGTEAITGPVLNSVLTAAVNTLGAGYQFMGVATTSTNPGTPDANVFYIAATPGTYTNFGGKTVADGEVAILKYNGSWTKEVTGAATAAQLTQLGQDVEDLVEEIDGQDGPFTDSVTTFAGKYINGAGTSGTIASYDSLSLAYVKVEKGVTYNIVFARTCSSAGWLLGYTPVADGASIVQILQDYGKGTNAAATISLLSTYDGYLAMGFATGYDAPVVTHNGHIDGIKEKTDDLMVAVFDSTTETNIECAYDATGKYISNTSGTIATYASLSLAYYPIVSGKRYHISWPATCNNAGYLLGYATAADGSTAVSVLTDYGKGFVPVKVYDADLDSAFTGYLAIGYNSGSVKPIVTQIDTEIGLHNKVSVLESKVTTLEEETTLKESVMFFGDSLTAASTLGIFGFAAIIAERIGLPYRAFLTDSGDGNTDDIPVDYPCFTNYGKDGTTLYINSSRPKPDSVVERVKRHITASANVDKILIECTINDEAHVDRKGTISDSYTATYDQTTTLGALEEICRYVSTLGERFKVGFFIPWQFSWQVSLDYFDDHIQVLKKWGLPYLDLRQSAGFNMKGCVVHGIYSLTSEDIASYNAETTYNTGNECKYAGQIYVCLSDNVVGVLPTNAEYWSMRSSSSRDRTHLNNIGHDIVAGKIQSFLKSL